MKNAVKLAAKFGRERSFSLRLKPASPFRCYRDGMAKSEAAPAAKPTALARGRTEADLDRLTDRLLRPLLEQANDLALLDSLRRAANEAAAAAWLTPFPLLFLPALLEEKASKASTHLARQKAILKKTQRRTDLAA